MDISALYSAAYPPGTKRDHCTRIASPTEVHRITGQVDSSREIYDGGADAIKLAQNVPSERRTFTVDDVYQIVETGIVDEDAHIERLDGELYVIGQQGPSTPRSRWFCTE
ncbi:MAG: hypothetical protein V3V08_12125 [Nannocystaceae bacterium]